MTMQDAINILNYKSSINEMVDESMTVAMEAYEDEQVQLSIINRLLTQVKVPYMQNTCFCNTCTR